MTDDSDSVRVAIVQASPVFLDAEASARKAAELIGEAADTGAALAAFGEGWIPGYPMHVFGQTGTDAWYEIASAYLQQAIDIPGTVTQILCEAASEAGIDVVIGVAERDPITQGTVYATQLFIGAEGEIRSRDRKLKANLHERTVWGDANAAQLGVHDRGYGIVSTLSGWDNRMPLTIQALGEQGTQLHVASWPGGDTPIVPSGTSAPWPQQVFLSRAFAAQAGCYVLCAGGTMTPADIPEQYRESITRQLSGGSVVIDPRGEIVAGPAEGETILVADCRMDVLRACKVAFDLGGHSGRSDLIPFDHPGAPPDGDDGYGQDDFGRGDFGQGDFSGSPFEGSYSSGYGNDPDAPDGGDGMQGDGMQGGWTSEPPPGYGSQGGSARNDRSRRARRR